jgi:hypothetical protein
VNRKYILPLFLLFQILFLKVLAFFPQVVESYYSNGLYIFTSRLERTVLGKIPFSFGDILYGILIIYILTSIWKAKKKWRVAGSLKNVRDNPWGQCHEPKNASAASSNVNIILAFPVLLAISASQIISLLSNLRSFPSCATVKLDVHTAPESRSSSSCCSRSTQTELPPGHVADVIFGCNPQPEQSNVSPASSEVPQSPSLSDGVDNCIRRDELADLIPPNSDFASPVFVDQSVDATESSAYQPAQLPSFVPPTAKSYYY